MGRPHPDWIQVVTGSHCWMWQQFPWEREVNPTGLTLHLWRLPSGVLDFGPDGLRSVFGEGMT